MSGTNGLNPLQAQGMEQGVDMIAAKSEYMCHAKRLERAGRKVRAGTG